MNALRISIGILGAIAIILWSAYRAGFYPPEHLGVRGPSLVVHRQEVMGTVCEITAYGRDEAKTRMAVQQAFGRIRELDRLLSNYDPISALSTINQKAAERPMPARPDLMEVLRTSVKISEETGGAFDVTVGPLMKEWGFFAKAGRLPSEESLKEIRKSVGYRYLIIDMEKGQVHFKRKGMELDLGAIGKGYALDRAARVLRENGVEAALLDFGSVQLAIGHPPERDHWTVGVRHPFDKRKLLGMVKLINRALSVSGDYERFFELKGRRYGHILDPRTGKPVQGVAMVAVVADSATEADALSTAAFVLGPTQGLGYLEEKGAEGAVVVPPTGIGADVRLMTTGRWQEIFEAEG